MFSTRSSIRVGRSESGNRLVRGQPDRRQKIQAAMTGPGSLGGSTSNVSGFAGGERVYISGIDVSTPYVDDIDHKTLCAMFRDIYLHDPVPGAAVDLMSNLPFSSFKLAVPATKESEKIEEIFDKTLKSLKITTLLPAILREHHVFGAHTSILIYKEAEKIFTDTLPLPPQDIEVISNILTGHDPILRMQRSELISKFLNDPSPIARSIIERINPKMVSMLRNGNFELDPLSTLYYPRKPWTFQDKGESYYRRILPLYMIEKVLFRGTLTLANRRQSSILHVTAGSDDWEITSDELSAIVQGFQNADKDPIGSVVGTRNEVTVNEVRQGGEFWKYNDITEQFDGKKLLALGINEAFLSGDMNYNSMEQALSVFMENLRATRDEATNVLFYNKIFPLISITNKITKSQYGISDLKTVTSASSIRRMESINIETKMMNMDDYIIPVIEWDKKLMPEGDEEQLNILEKLEEKGVPLSVRAWAVAGGLNMEDLMKMKEASIEDEVRMANIDKIRKEKLSKAGGEKSDSDKDSNDEDFLSSFNRDESFTGIPLTARKFKDSDFELYEKKVTGGRKYKMNQDSKQKQANYMIAATLKRMSQKNGKSKSYLMASKKNEVEK